MHEAHHGTHPGNSLSRVRLLAGLFLLLIAVFLLWDIIMGVVCLIGGLGLINYALKQ